MVNIPLSFTETISTQLSPLLCWDSLFRPLKLQQPRFAGLLLQSSLKSFKNISSLRVNSIYEMLSTSHQHAKCVCFTVMISVVNIQFWDVDNAYYNNVSP